MNSRERFLTALKGQPVDRPPLAHVSALTTVELQAMTACTMPNVHRDPETLARLSFANHEVLGFDAVSFIINYFNEPAALGCALNWGSEKQLPMYTSHPWSRAADATVPSDLLLRMPLRSCLQMLRLAKKNYGQHVAILGKVMGPFSMAQVMHGVENVMLGLVDQPDLMRHFIDTAADIAVRFANAQFEAGADAVAIGEGGAGANMLSPAMYEAVLMGSHQRMIQAIHGHVIMHICGDITPRLDRLGQIGLTCFNFDWSISPRIMKDACRNRFTIMGNVNTTDLLNGSPEQIKAQVRENLAAGVDIISPGCAVSPLCPNRNFLAMRQALDDYNP